MGRGLVSAIVATLVTAAILGGFFISWKRSADQKVLSNPILSLGQMETEGVPLFELPNLKGEVVRLGDFKDKIILINFWASWCAPCIDEFPSMLKLVREFPNEMVLIAVSRDRTREDMEVFLKAFPQINEPNVRVVWDEGGDVAKSYGVDRLPESFLTKRNFKLSRKIIGSIPWHTEDSLSFIKALSAEKP